MPYGFNENKSKADMPIIIANPSGTASETLEKISIDGTNYKVGSSGGGDIFEIVPFYISGGQILANKEDVTNANYSSYPPSRYTYFGISSWETNNPNLILREFYVKEENGENRVHCVIKNIGDSTISPISFSIYFIMMKQ